MSQFAGVYHMVRKYGGRHIEAEFPNGAKFRCGNLAFDPTPLNEVGVEPGGKGELKMTMWPMYLAAYKRGRRR